MVLGSAAPGPGLIMMAADLIANRYRIVREIARSNDVVYEALDTAVGRRVALKELLVPPNLTGQARRDRIERFIREARAAGKLSHPNIVTVYDFGEEAGRHYIVMEYLEGITLRDALQARGALPLAEAVGIAAKVLAGLAHAHSHNVVHRDVKPDNIHLLPDGQVKLADFGIARITEEASLTGEGQVFGTPSYMSPEQIEGRLVDHRTDIFSMGVVLYEMLAGRKPFQGDSVVSITYAIMHAEPLPIAGVPDAIQQVVFQALNKNPLLRFQTAEAMREALLAAQKAPDAAAWKQSGMGHASRPPLPGGPLMTGAPSAQTHPGSLLSGLPAGHGPSGPLVPGPPPVIVPSAPASAGAGGIPSQMGGSWQPSSAPMSGQVPAPAPPGSAPGMAFAPPAQGGGTIAGPFATWGSGQSPSAGVPPPPPVPLRRNAGMSQGTRSFMLVFGAVVVISGAILGLVVLFLKAYDEQKQNAIAARAADLNESGLKLYRANDLEGAAAKFDAAMKAAPGTDASDVARRNLVQTYNMLGIKAYQARNFARARSYWSKALELDRGNPEVQDNLSRLQGQPGSYPSALPDDFGGSQGADTGSLGPREREAQDWLKRGIEAYGRGDTSAARDAWQRALAAAPGTNAAMQAQQWLNQTQSAPNFGGAE